MKKILFIAAVALAAAACSKTYNVGPESQKAIGFTSWNDVMTKADKTAFVNDDVIEVYGYKHNNGANKTTVFDDVDVKYNGSSWTYSPARFWDSNFDNYTFYAVYPKDVLSAADAQTGIFTTNELTYDGENEQLLIAKETPVAKASYGSAVNLVFKHLASKIDIRVKKHSEISDVKLTVNSISLNNLQTKGYFTVASYDASSHEPVGAWTKASTPVLNDNSATPYKSTTAVELAAGTGTSTATAGALISNLIAMPQDLTTGTGAQSITINYTLTTGTTGNEDSVTYNTTFEIGQFDSTDPDPTDKDNTAPFISSWVPGVHYTYYITVNAQNKITFTADIDAWTTATDITGHHYVIL